MHTLSNADFLSLWERGRPLHPLDRGLLAIALAFPDAAREAVADWPLGRRNRALAQLRCQYFGSVLEAWTSCAHCGEKVELKMDAGAMIATYRPDEQEHATVTMGTERFRLPTTRDVANALGGASALPDPGAGAVRLARSCLLDRAGLEEPDWTDDQLEEIGTRMAEADPLAEILLEFTCPECGTSSNGSLDIAAFLWEEIEAEARRLLYDVHLLASAYGWSEPEILALSRPRRRLYVDMVRA